MNNRGQSLIEAALFFTVLAPLIGMLLGFTAWFQTREKLILAAWQGAQLYSSGCISPAEVDRQLREFLTTGTPMLDRTRIQIKLGRASGPSAIYYHLDKVSISYRSPQPWHRLLNLSQTLEESCTIAHAPHYWDPLMDLFPIPNAPPLHGPAYPW